LIKVLTTHVGSLPFTDTQAALDYTFLFDLPVLPSLPKLNENQFMGRDIIHQLGIGECTKDFRLNLNQDFLKCTEDLNPPLLEEFIQILNDKKLIEFKYQLIGPISFYRMLEKPSVSFKVVADFLEEKYIKLLHLLNSKGKCIFYLDEPFLNTASPQELALLNSFTASLKKTKSLIGIHICSEISEEQLLTVNSDIVNIDSKLIAPSSCLRDVEMSHFGLDGGTFPVGYIDQLEKSQVGSRVHLSPSCGLANAGQNEIEFIPRILRRNASLIIVKNF